MHPVICLYGSTVSASLHPVGYLLASWKGWHFKAINRWHQGCEGIIGTDLVPGLVLECFLGALVAVFTCFFSLLLQVGVVA